MTRSDRVLLNAGNSRLPTAAQRILENLGSRSGTFVKVRGTGPLTVNGMVLLGNQLLRAVRQ